MPVNGSAKRRLELTTRRRAATADGSVGARRARALTALRFFRTYVGLGRGKFGAERPTYLPTYLPTLASGRRTYLPTYLIFRYFTK